MGLARFISISGHSDPQVLVEALRRYPFDTALVAVSALDHVIYSFAEESLPVAARVGVGVVGMKVIALGKLAHIAGPALRYALGLPLTTVSVGCSTLAELQPWLEPIASAVGAQLLVTDDADAFKSVAEDLGLEHQVCKSHVKRHTEALIETLKTAVQPEADRSLQRLALSLEQAVADLEQLGELIGRRRPEEVAILERLHDRYALAPAPRAGERASVAYRLRLLFLDRWNLWSRLTRYRTWRGPQGEMIDGTNNSERGIGWWIKERYRTRRGYKRPRSAVNVSRLLAWAGHHLNTGGANLASLLA